MDDILIMTKFNSIHYNIYYIPIYNNNNIYIRGSKVGVIIVGVIIVGVIVVVFNILIVVVVLFLFLL